MRLARACIGAAKSGAASSARAAPASSASSAGAGAESGAAGRSTTTRARRVRPTSSASASRAPPWRAPAPPAACFGSPPGPGSAAPRLPSAHVRERAPGRVGFALGPAGAGAGRGVLGAVGDGGGGARGERVRDRAVALLRAVAPGAELARADRVQLQRQHLRARRGSC